MVEKNIQRTIFFFFLRWKPSKERMVVQKLIEVKMSIKMKVSNHYTKIFCLHQNMWFLWYCKCSSYVMYSQKIWKDIFLLGVPFMMHLQVVLMIKNFVNFWFCNEMQTQDTFLNSQQRKMYKSSKMKLK